MRSKNQEGFTLIELILVIALVAIAIGVSGDTLISLIRGYNKSQVINEIEQNANFISQKLNKELRNAANIIAVGDPDLTAGDFSNELVFRDRDSNYIRYKVENNVLSRSKDTGTANYLPLSVSTTTFGVNMTCTTPDACFVLLQEDPQVVQIEITITQSGTPSSVVFTGEVVIEDTIVIRNTY